MMIPTYWVVSAFLPQNTLEANGRHSALMFILQRLNNWMDFTVVNISFGFSLFRRIRKFPRSTLDYIVYKQIYGGYNTDMQDSVKFIGETKWGKTESGGTQVIATFEKFMAHDKQPERWSNESFRSIRIECMASRKRKIFKISPFLHGVLNISVQEMGIKLQMFCRDFPWFANDIWSNMRDSPARRTFHVLSIRQQLAKLSKYNILPGWLNTKMSACMNQCCI